MGLKHARPQLAPVEAWAAKYRTVKKVVVGPTLTVCVADPAKQAEGWLDPADVPPLLPPPLPHSPQQRVHTEQGLSVVAKWTKLLSSAFSPFSSSSASSASSS
eukprot:CAMPEP_0175146256 /NCGR_PEP_ID=MMETSP0087-20121206/15277_1 /TAXON_ID=136419 /ORGANISM="Unknown Unknown, Strain D1" /LENGTH=102 /DNA_ID=CAMNT_0016431197 /DNA_START=294 /DNA_END=598 /DNA_ORIENTATION=+